MRISAPSQKCRSRPAASEGTRAHWSTCRRYASASTGRTNPPQATTSPLESPEPSGACPTTPTADMAKSVRVRFWSSFVLVFSSVAPIPSSQT